MALAKLQAYCAYQERCHQEVQAKLAELGVWGDAADAIIVALIRDNFLNEERFAVTFARGKFRIKHWGKVRIQQELQRRQIPAYCIKKALQAIDEEGQYEAILEKILRQKASDYTDDPQKKFKLAQYALRKGFESAFIWPLLERLFPEK